MSKYIAKVGEWITPSETSGSIQNTSTGGITIEVTSDATQNAGLTLASMQIINFDGTVYVRSAGKKEATFTVVPFKIAAGGGGGGGGSSYTLPTASATVKGGIKVGSRLSIVNQVLSADKQLENWVTNTKYEVGETALINGKIYRCKSNHTSTFPINMNNWEPLYAELPTWSANTDYQVGDVVINGSSIYTCKTAHTSGATFDSTKFNNLSGGGSVTEDITANTAAGAIAIGDVVKEGTTLTQFVKQLLVAEIEPTITFTATNSGLVKIGDSKTTVLKLVINNNGTGTPQSIVFINGTTTLDTQTYVAGTNTYTYTPTDVIESATTDTIKFKAVLNYKKSDNSNATLTKEQKFTFVDPVYYGAVTSAPASSADVLAVGGETASGANSKGRTVTYTLSNQKSCYCYPTSLGALTSIKDANNFEYIGSYDRATVSVTRNITTTTGGATTRTASYYVYTLKDPVTITGFKQIFA